MTYKTSTGNTIRLGPRKIGQGGEGEVLPVEGHQDLVAKIYRNPTEAKQKKIELMIANPVPQCRDHFWVTWPLEAIFTSDPTPRFAGYIMQRLTNCHPLFTCYTPATRCKMLPDFSYQHLVRCGRNLSAAFCLAHAHRHVIGDPNESNAFVTNDARVTLLDVDSWQITDVVHGRTYRSVVAKAEFLPAELQNLNLENLDRHPWHDNFALSVLLFKMFAEGNHPFDGVYHGSGDVPTLGARIAAGKFPYRDKSGCWTPKGSALPFDSLHPRLQTLFLRAFVDGHTQPQARPDAGTWRAAIALAESELQGCHNNSHHWFWGSQCVWCERQSLLRGRDPFPGPKPIIGRHRSVPASPTPAFLPTSPLMAKPALAPVLPRRACRRLPAKALPTLVNMLTSWLAPKPSLTAIPSPAPAQLKTMEYLEMILRRVAFISVLLAIFFGAIFAVIKAKLRPLHDAELMKTEPPTKTESATGMQLRASPPRAYLGAGVNSPAVGNAVVCTATGISGDGDCVVGNSEAVSTEVARNGDDYIVDRSTRIVFTRAGGIVVEKNGAGRAGAVSIGGDGTIVVRNGGAEIRVGKNGVWIDGAKIGTGNP
ncbi:MAG: hypothetical protein P4N59_05040 [Negativicutes bacterium]|nr:hypothetical protein [Negativicutes bacterium]